VCSSTRGGSVAVRGDVGERGGDLRRAHGSVAVRDVEHQRLAEQPAQVDVAEAVAPVVVVPGRVDVRARVQAGVDGVHVDGVALGDAGVRRERERGVAGPGRVPGGERAGDVEQRRPVGREARGAGHDAATPSTASVRWAGAAPPRRSAAWRTAAPRARSSGRPGPAARLDHHPHERLGAGRPDVDAPVAGQVGLGVGHGGDTSGSSQRPSFHPPAPAR
jgi:hypothetical protein